MAKFIIRRLLLMILTMLVISALIFGISEMTPSNIARNVLGAYATPQQEASFLAQLGLDRPLPARYLAWLIGTDWQAERKTDLSLTRIETDLGFSEWWAKEGDGVLIRWKLDGSDLIAVRRYPDGTVDQQLDNEKWQTDESGTRYFWGLDNKNRAVKWVMGPEIAPTGIIDLLFSDGTTLDDANLHDSNGLIVSASSGAREPGSLPMGEWIEREIDLSALQGETIYSVSLNIDYQIPDAPLPTEMIAFIDRVKIVQADNGEKIWQGDPTSFTVSAEDDFFTASTVDADKAGVGHQDLTVFQLAGTFTDQEPAIDHPLVDGLSIPITEGTTLSYRIYFAPRSGGEVVWELTTSGWASRRGGAVEYVPLQKGFMRGDPGESLKSGQPVAKTLMRRVKNSVLLAAIAFALIMPIAVLLGVAAGLNHGRFIDRFLSIAGLVSTGTPEFATGVILILIFASWLKVLPGATVFPSDNAAFENPQMLILPVLTLTMIELGYVLRITRASVVEVMREPYIRTASLKGLPYRQIVFRHALRNAMMAPITVIMLHVTWLIGGIVVVEAIFGFPGLGKYLYDAALFNDVFAIEAGAMVMVMMAAGTQLIADIIYTFLNPRIRFS